MWASFLALVFFASWNTGDHILVIARDGRRLMGVVVTLSVDQLVLNRQGVLLTFQRNEILKLETPTQMISPDRRQPQEKVIASDLAVPVDLSDSLTVTDTVEGMLKELAALPSDQPRPFAQTWNRLGSSPIEALATIDAGDPNLEEYCLGLLLTQVSGDLIETAWLWYLGWARSPAWTRALSHLDNLDQRQALRIGLNLLGREDLPNSGALRRQLDSWILRATQEDHQELKGVLVYRLRSGPREGRLLAARWLGSHSPLERNDWRRILEARETSVRATFLAAAAERQLQVPDIHIIISRLSSSTEEAAAGLRLLAEQINQPPLQRQELEIIYQAGRSLKDVRGRQLAEELLKSATGMNWPLTSTEWSSFFTP